MYELVLLQVRASIQSFVWSLEVQLEAEPSSRMLQHDDQEQ